MRKPHGSGRGGFTLIELLVVILIIGILASIAVPQYFKLVERGRVAEGLSCLSTLKGSQQRYQLRNGVFSNTLGNLDTTCPTMKFFNMPMVTGTDASTGRTSDTGFGTYTLGMVYTGNAVTCSGGTNCSDLLPP